MVDLVITPANVQASAKGRANGRTGTAGATITAGMPLYADASDSGALKPAQADAATTDGVVGFALNGAADGQPVEYTDDDPDYNPGAVLTVGQAYVLSAAAAGGVAPITDLVATNYPVILGVATAANKLPINIINSGVAKA